MAKNVRLTATVDEAIADHVRVLASGLGMSVTRLLGLLITIAVNAGGDTFETFAKELEVLKGDVGK